MGMTHRERVVRALNHETTDRVPMDFGGGPATQINPIAYERLLTHLGFEPERERSGEVLIPSEKVLQHFDIDVRGTFIGQADGAKVIPIDEHSYIDEWGVTWRRAYPRAPHINVKGPLQHLTDPTATALDNLDWPDPKDPGRIRGLRDRTLRIREDTDCAIVLNLGNATLALAQRLRGFGELLEDLLLNPDFAGALMERVTEVVCGTATAAVSEVADLVDAVSTADDLGIQAQAFMHPDLYRTMVKPHHAKLAATVHELTDAKMILHSDGAVQELLTDFIDAGIDVLNPVQVNTFGMTATELNREYGKDLCFWGGIDTQHVLPFGSPDDVTNAVLNCIDELGPGGGYVVASVHNILAEVPPENIVAMFEAVAKTKVA